MAELLAAEQKPGADAEALQSEALLTLARAQDAHVSFQLADMEATLEMRRCGRARIDWRCQFAPERVLVPGRGFSVIVRDERWGTLEMSLAMTAPVARGRLLHCE